MFVYTVKLVVNKETKNNFIAYLYNIHLPDVVNTGCFLDYSLELDTSKDEIMARYRCESQELFNKYLLNHADAMRSVVLEKFPNSIINAERNFCECFNS